MILLRESWSSQPLLSLAGEFRAVRYSALVEHLALPILVVVPTVPQGKRGVRWNPFGFCPPGCPVCFIPICASAVKSDIKSHMTRLLCFLRNWYVDEPSCGSEICVVMYHQPSAPPGVGGPYMFQWNDDRCNMKNNFICKYALGNESFCSFKNQPAPSSQEDIWDGSNR